MDNFFYGTLYLVLIACFLHSCTYTIIPGLHSSRLGPRIIEPISQNGNIDALPENANFVQSYSNYRKSKTDSKFGALVRIIEFEYDITDSLVIIPRITSGYDEGAMTGLVTILLDQYELTYDYEFPQIREYVEKVSYESSKPIRQVRTLSSVSTIRNATQKAQMNIVNRSQLYNSAKYSLENEDVNLFLRSKTLSYIIHLQNSTLSIFPSKEQIRILKRMIQKHYAP